MIDEFYMESRNEEGHYIIEGQHVSGFEFEGETGLSAVKEVMKQEPDNYWYRRSNREGTTYSHALRSDSRHRSKIHLYPDTGDIELEFKYGSDAVEFTWEGFKEDIEARLRGVTKDGELDSAPIHKNVRRQWEKDQK